MIRSCISFASVLCGGLCIVVGFRFCPENSVSSEHLLANARNIFGGAATNLTDPGDCSANNQCFVQFEVACQGDYPKCEEQSWCFRDENDVLVCPDNKKGDYPDDKKVTGVRCGDEGANGRTEQDKVRCYVRTNCDCEWVIQQAKYRCVMGSYVDAGVTHEYTSFRSDGTPYNGACPPVQ